LIASRDLPDLHAAVSEKGEMEWCGTYERRSKPMKQAGGWRQIKTRENFTSDLYRPGDASPPGRLFYDNDKGVDPKERCLLWFC
jgi:hypothetical protein